MSEVTAQAEGVNTTEETPTPSEESPTSVQGEDQADELPFGKHPRWQKMLKERDRFKSESSKFRKEFDEYKKTAEEAVKFYQSVAGSGPEKIKKVMEIISAQQEQIEDPYADFNPVVAERFREWDEFKKWLGEQAELQKQHSAQAIKDNEVSLEAKYAQKLEKDGFIKNGKDIDPVLGRAIDKLTKSFLEDIAKNPQYPTVEELDQAYEDAKLAILKAEKRGVRTVKPTSVPATGSKSGMPATGNKKETREERVARIASML